MIEDKFPDHLVEMWVGIRVEMSGYFPVKIPWWLLLLPMSPTPLIFASLLSDKRLGAKMKKRGGY